MGVSSHEDNTYKLERWRSIVEQAEDGRPILLIDTDTVILRELDSVWDTAFDVAYTVKPKDSRFPLNGGVIFLRAGHTANLFMSYWASTNRSFLVNRSFRASPLRRQFGGINQAAVGATFATLEQEKTQIQVCQLACAEWNCEDESWHRFGPDTRILHIKSGLRREILKLSGPRVKYAHAAAVQAWKQMEALAVNAAANAST